MQIHSSNECAGGLVIAHSLAIQVARLQISTSAPVQQPYNRRWRNINFYIRLIISKIWKKSSTSRVGQMKNYRLYADTRQRALWLQNCFYSPQFGV